MTQDKLAEALDNFLLAIFLQNEINKTRKKRWTQTR
jgi:hypothetical protein